MALVPLSQRRRYARAFTGLGAGEITDPNDPGYIHHSPGTIFDGWTTEEVNAYWEAKGAHVNTGLTKPTGYDSHGVAIYDPDAMQSEEARLLKLSASDKAVAAAIAAGGQVDQTASNALQAARNAELAAKEKAAAEAAIRQIGAGVNANAVTTTTATPSTVVASSFQTANTTGGNALPVPVPPNQAVVWTDSNVPHLVDAPHVVAAKQAASSATIGVAALTVIAAWFFLRGRRQ